MIGLIADRFLKLFAGDLPRRLKQTIFPVKGPDTEAITEVTAGPCDTVTVEGHEKDIAQGNHLPDENEPLKKNDSELENK